MSVTRRFPTKLVHTLKTHNGPVNTVTFSSYPGTYLLTGSSDRAIHLSRALPASSSSSHASSAAAAETTAPIQKYQAHGYSVLDVAVTADNSRFASVGGDKQVFLWDVEQGGTVRRWTGHQARVEAVQFAGEGDWVVVSGSADTTVNLWDARSSSYKPIQTLTEATDTVSSLHVHMPTYSIASGSYDGRVRVYDIRQGRTTVDVLAHPVTSVRCSADGNALLASTLDGRIRMLDRADGKLLRAFGGEDGGPARPKYRNKELRVRSVFAKADAAVLSGSEADDSGEASVFAWDVLSGEVIATVPAGKGVKVVSCVAWNEEGGCWAGGCADGALLASSAVARMTVLRQEPFVPGNQLPRSHAASDGAEIVKLFASLDRDTEWKLISKTPFAGDTGEPEGMVRLGDDRFFLSAGDWTVPTERYNGTINGTDRTPGAGFAHLLVYDARGNRLADANLTGPGDIEYHGGGIDYDGRSLWITLSQYRPSTTATVVRIDPLTLAPTPLFRAADHLGAIIHDTVTDDLVTLNWGARIATTWSLRHYPRGFAPLPGVTAPGRKPVPNPTSFVDYQDCKFLGHHPAPGSPGHDDTTTIRPIMFCAGVATHLGGIALVDTRTMLPLWEVPLALTSDAGTPLTQNPVDVAVVGGRLRIYCLPDRRGSVLYVYEAVL
ncbi:hypothetical protein VTN02DRAFT_6204 [Thermoascus thermophilus]